MSAIYRVVLNVGYNKAYFEFADASEAIAFAQTALVNAVGCDDTKKRSSITMQVVDPEAEAKEREEE